MDRKGSKLHKTARAVHDKAVDWLQKMLQMPSSQENSPSQPRRPTNTASNESCLNGNQATGFNSTSPMLFDRIKLHFKVRHFLLALLSLYMSKLHWTEFLSARATSAVPNVPFRGFLRICAARKIVTADCAHGVAFQNVCLQGFARRPHIFYKGPCKRSLQPSTFASKISPFSDIQNAHHILHIPYPVPNTPITGLSSPPFTQTSHPSHISIQRRTAGRRPQLYHICQT